MPYIVYMDLYCSSWKLGANLLQAGMLNSTMVSGLLIQHCVANVSSKKKGPPRDGLSGYFEQK